MEHICLFNYLAVKKKCNFIPRGWLTNCDLCFASLELGKRDLDILLAASSNAFMTEEGVNDCSLLRESSSIFQNLAMGRCGFFYLSLPVTDSFFTFVLHMGQL